MLSSRAVRVLVAIAVLVLAVLGGGLLYASLKKPAQRATSNEVFARTPERLARGQYLVEAVTACFSCHSEKNGDLFTMPPLAGKEGGGDKTCFDEKWGYPGRVCVPNITPDPKTGIGSWSDDQILRAIREGVRADGSALFGMMPYHNYRVLSDEDAKSIVVYLRTIPAIEVSRERTSLRFPVSYYLKAEPQPLLGPVPEVAADPIALGKYLAEVAGCRSCHTPVDADYRPIPGKEYSGGQDFAIDTGVSRRSTNLTPHMKTGIGRLDKLEFIAKFTRHAAVPAQTVPPDRNTLMPWLSFAKMKPEDLAAIHDYLQTIPAIDNYVRR